MTTTGRRSTLAAANGHQDVVEWLLAHGADIERGNARTTAPLCRRNGQQDVAELLLATRCGHEAQDNDKGRRSPCYRERS